MSLNSWFSMAEYQLFPSLDTWNVAGLVTNTLRRTELYGASWICLLSHRRIETILHFAFCTRLFCTALFWKPLLCIDGCFEDRCFGSKPWFLQLAAVDHDVRSRCRRLHYRKWRRRGRSATQWTGWIRKWRRTVPNDVWRRRQSAKVWRQCKPIPCSTLIASSPDPDHFFCFVFFTTCTPLKCTITHPNVRVIFAFLLSCFKRDSCSTCPYLCLLRQVQSSRSKVSSQK